MSVHVACELFYGVELSDRAEEERTAVEGMREIMQLVWPGPAFPSLYGSLDAALTRQGKRIGTMDLLIATAAIENVATLVTRNTSEMGRIPGLSVLKY
jgi:tRNA(fMet)-specific endonuclease VapC